MFDPNLASASRALVQRTTDRLFSALPSTTRRGYTLGNNDRLAD